MNDPKAPLAPVTASAGDLLDSEQHIVGHDQGGPRFSDDARNARRGINPDSVLRTGWERFGDAGNRR